MAEAKHTPGPGPCVWNGNEIVSAAEPNKVVAGLAPDAPDEWGALFAAAPELYEALEALVGEIEWEIGEEKWGRDPDALAKAKRALAKARGEAS